MYEPRIEELKDGTFHALVVRVDDDGEIFVCRFPSSRYFKTLKGAQSFTDREIKKMG